MADSIREFIIEQCDLPLRSEDKADSIVKAFEVLVEQAKPEFKYVIDYGSPNPRYRQLLGNELARYKQNLRELLK